MRYLTQNQWIGAVRAIYDASDDRGILQAADMLALSRAGHVPNDPRLHVAMQIPEALRAAGLSESEIKFLTEI